MRWILILMLLVGCSATADKVVDKEQLVGNYDNLWGASVEDVMVQFPGTYLDAEDFSDADFRSVNTVLYKKNYDVKKDKILTRTFLFLDGELVKVMEGYNPLKADVVGVKLEISAIYLFPTKSWVKKSSKGHDVTTYRYRDTPKSMVYSLNFKAGGRDTLMCMFLSSEHYNQVKNK